MADPYVQGAGDHVHHAADRLGDRADEAAAETGDCAAHKRRIADHAENGVLENSDEPACDVAAQ